jgi:CRP-like cAMP-binding protein
MDARVFAKLSAAPGALHRVMLRYTQACLAQAAQTATCGGTHLLQERCAGWLLMTRERVEANEFPCTHEVLSSVLGVQPGGVTLAMRWLEDRQLIRYIGGRVEIVDAVRLKGASCQRHKLVSAEYARLPPAVA